MYCGTVETRYNEVPGTMKITLLYQVSHYIRVTKQRNIESWDQVNYLVIRGFCYIRPLYNEVPLYITYYKRYRDGLKRYFKTSWVNLVTEMKIVVRVHGLFVKFDCCKITHVCSYSIILFFQTIKKRLYYKNVKRIGTYNIGSPKTEKLVPQPL